MLFLDYIGPIDPAVIIWVLIFVFLFILFILWKLFPKAKFVERTTDKFVDWVHEIFRFL